MTPLDLDRASDRLAALCDPRAMVDVWESAPGEWAVVVWPTGVGKSPAHTFHGSTPLAAIGAAEAWIVMNKEKAE